MKKIIMKYRIFALIACVLLLTQTYTYAQNATTEARVQFAAGVGPTFPVDPEIPGTNIDTEPSVAGSLAIVKVSDFNFGTISVTAAAGLYDIQTTQPNIQVVDLRGTGTGWKVSAAVSRFKNGASESLPGAAILIKNGRTNSLSTSAAPVQSIVRLTTDNVPAPVMTAAAEAGTGLWVMRWYPATGAAYVQLDIPAATATVGSHTATINWTLANAPA